MAKEARPDPGGRQELTRPLGESVVSAESEGSGKEAQQASLQGLPQKGKTTS